ncbi:MAG: hypothetical protein ACE5JS_11030 [Nitrospinota bacterium]
MKLFVKVTGTLIFLAGGLFWADPGWSGCITPVDGPECQPLIGVKVVGLLTEVQEDAAVAKIAKGALSDTAFNTIRKLLPQIRIDDDPTRAPQIYILVAALHQKNSESALHLKVEVRDVGTQDGRLIWRPIWHTSYVIPAPARNPVSDLDDPLKESLAHLAADWRRANQAGNR